MPSIAYTKNGERLSLADDISEPSTLVYIARHSATENKWNTGQLVKRWERRRTDVLQTDHKKSLAATIDLSLACPMFRELGRDARAILEVVAFFLVSRVVFLP